MNVNCIRKIGMLRVATRMLAIAALLLVLFPAGVSAELREMSDAQLAEVTGSGFTNFILEEDIARAEFNVRAATYTEIDDMRLGYYDNGGGAGWDQKWSGVTLGTPDRDMVMEGFFFQSEFDNLSDPDNRCLLAVQMGFRAVSGTLSAASISSFSGDVGGVLLDGQRVNLDEQGVSTFHFDNAELSLTIGVAEGRQGIWLHFGAGTTME